MTHYIPLFCFTIKSAAGSVTYMFEIIFCMMIVGLPLFGNFFAVDNFLNSHSNSSQKFLSIISILAAGWQMKNPLSPKAGGKKWPSPSSTMVRQFGQVNFFFGAKSFLLFLVEFVNFIGRGTF